MITLTIGLTTFVSTLMVLLVLIRLAPALKLMDHPGGRKDHLGKTPVVGGLAMGIVFVTVLIFFQTHAWWVAAIAIVTLVALGVMDDIHDLRPLPKLLVQACAILLMFYLADFKLVSVGDLIGMGSIGTWILAPVVTVFAVIGVINAINMSDGIDGHAGFISLIAFLAYAYVARESALWEQYKLLVALSGSAMAFLAMNARTPWLRHARTFFGDAGSLVMGFIIAWFAVDLTQGDGRTFSPICALWVVVIPLCDCVSLMIRRRLDGGSMFKADRQHLHHYLLMRGLSVGQATMASASANLTCAAIGVLGWKFKVPEPAMFGGFVSLFIAYHLTMSRVFHKPQYQGVAKNRAATEIPIN